MASKIRCNDEVIVIAGKDKGKRGKVTRIVSAGYAIIEGINLVTKHQKENPNAGIGGGRIKKEAPTHISNVAVFNTATGKADRIGFRFENNRKIRFFKSNNAAV